MPEDARGPLPDATVPTDHRIAVVGLSCRLPKAPDPDVPWRLPDDAADAFDPAFFGISPREAASMGPRRRLVLELCWEALEHAGIVPGSLRGARVGVFVGAVRDGHAAPSYQQGPETIGHRTGGLLGLRGPSTTVYAGRSSSLVAVHLACESLRGGECDAALVGGLGPEPVPGAAGPAGPAAGARDRGAVRCEGGGVVVLKSLARALADGDRVLGVITGSGVGGGEDGGTGPDAPGGRSREEALRRVRERAGVGPRGVRYVEPHGAVGITDLIGALPGLGPDRREPARAPRSGESGRRLVVGLGSGGAGGGPDCHVVLEEAPRTAPAAGSDGTNGTDGPDGAAHPLPYTVSGTTPEALRAQARRLLGWLGEHSGARPGALSRALATTRTAFAHRAVVVAADREELARGLEALARDRRAAGLVRGTAVRRRDLAVLFTGEGGQRPGTGRGLYRAFPVFAAAFDEVCAHLGGGVREAVFGDDADAAAEALGRTGTAQAALFAVEVALYRLVESWGVVPKFVGGHSAGEIAAAHVAGVLSLKDAAVLVTARGRLMEALPGAGLMVAVRTGAEEVAPLLVPGTALAAVNGPRDVVVSGAREAVRAVVGRLAEQDVKSKTLRAGHAFHSPLMDPMLEEFRRAIAGLDFRRPRIAFVSALTGGIVGDEVAHPDYWVGHVRETVRFQDAVRTLESEGATAVLELGPEGVLAAMARPCLADEGAVVVPALCRRGDEVRALLTATATLYAHGVIGRLPLGIPAGAPLHGLPTYPFRREDRRPGRGAAARAARYPVGGPARAHRAAGAGTHGAGTAATGTTAAATAATGTAATGTAPTGMAATGHPLAAWRLDLPEAGAVLFTGTVSARSHPEFAGAGRVPAQALLEAALAVGGAIGAPEVEEAAAEAALTLPARGGVLLQLLAQAPDGAGRRRLTVVSRAGGADPEEPWVRHLTAVLAPGRAPSFALAEWPPDGAEPLEGAEEHPAVERAWRRGEEFLAELLLPAGLHGQPYALHPELLEAALHPVLAAAPEPLSAGEWRGTALYATGATSLRVRAVRGAFGVVALELADAEGGPVAAASVTLSELPGGPGRRPVTPLAPVWERVAEAAEPVRGPRRALLGVPGGGSCPSPLPECDGAPVYAGLPELLTAAADGRPVPELVLARLAEPATDAELYGRGVAAAVDEVRELVGAWLAEERLAGSVLAVVTGGAEEVLPGEGVADLVGAAVRGFVRSVQAWLAGTGGGRIMLVDVDDSDASRKALVRALGGGEPDLALRDGVAYARRLVRAECVVPGAGAGAGTGGPGTVRLSGAVEGPRARESARHLVEAYGVRLVGPGEEAAAVVHLSGPDGPSLEASVDAALALDGRPTPLAFVTTVGAAVGSGGPESDMVVGAFLTALAARRRAAGLPAAVLGWGADPEGLPAGLAVPAGGDGAALLGHALARSLTLVAARADAAGLRAAGGPVPALLRSLVVQRPRRAANRRADEGTSPAGPPAEPGPGAGPEQAPSAAGGTFAGLLRGAHAQGRTAEGAALLMAAAELLPGYDSRSGVARWPAPVRLAGGPEGAAGLFAFPSLGASSGPGEFLALAAALEGRRGLTVLAHPGFAGDAVLPRSRQALVRAQAEAVAEAAGPTRPVLLGHSSGGWIAHAVARELLEIGREAAAVVLLDTYARGGNRRGPAALTERLFDPAGPPGMADDTRLLAMGGHLRLFTDWTPEPASAPTLLVRASASAASATAGWEYADHLAEVVGDHLSLLGADAGAVADTVDGWLRKVAG
ncbi:acyltransferase domain-containing protein [Streptomyces katrae]|uniref:Acyltransferase domain-containing protein n=1 Tax=Streptomyces katrae TaxID=68223 RepID=A0ABT7GPB5_9ACTN|nr:acyltransferase domain-containing protein [Streptomyces katrae]MDK9495432.1 acyltransferase domain-containing protein [Streptomyces katrae]